MPHFFAQALFVYSPYLLKQYHGILCKSEISGIDIYMSGELHLVKPACYRGGDDCRAVFVSHIILYYENGSQSSLLASDNRTEVGIEKYLLVLRSIFFTLFFYSLKEKNFLLYFFTDFTALLVKEINKPYAKNLTKKYAAYHFLI